MAFKEVGHIFMARKSRRGDAALLGFGRNHARMVRCDRGGSIRQTATNFGGKANGYQDMVHSSLRKEKGKQANIILASI